MNVTTEDALHTPLRARKERARHRGIHYTNPYHRGYVKNWQQVFGSHLPWWRAILPSTRLPPSPLNVVYEEEAVALRSSSGRGEEVSVV